MSRPAALVLDFNGTISDDEQLLEELYRALFAEIGLDLSGERYQREFAGLSDPRSSRAASTSPGARTRRGSRPG